MKKTAIMILVALGLFTNNVLAKPATVIFEQIKSGSACVVPKLEGERIPFPLRKANTKFELAENETYLLTGMVVMMNGRSYFRVDFNSQPWLATEKMLQNPYFPVDEATISVGQANGRLVQVAVVARKNDALSQSEGGNTALKLEPIMPPMSISY